MSFGDNQNVSALAVASSCTLLDSYAGGRKEAADELVQWLYPELRKMAARHMRREGAGHSWQPTLLVNELYLELLKNPALDRGNLDESRKAALLGLAGFLMRRLLIIHSRPLRQRASEVGEDAAVMLPAVTPDPEQLHAVENVLERLAAIDPRHRTVVEMRVFEGRSHEEIAEHLGCTVRTVGTYWAFARRWLQQELE